MVISKLMVFFPKNISYSYQKIDEELLREVREEQDTVFNNLSGLLDLDNIKVDIIKAPDYSKSSAIFYKLPFITKDKILFGTQIWINHPFYQGSFNNYNFGGKVFNDKLVIHQQ